MKSIANQYRDLKEGRMSQANFMRNLRMNMPQYITNITSFNDAIRILKNKAILTESGHGDAPISQMSRKDMIDFLGTTEEKAKDMSDEELRDAVADKNEDIKENDDDAEIEDMIAKAEEEESGKHTKFQDVPGAISEEYDFPRGAEAMAEFVARKYGSELKQLPSREKEKMALSHAYETILKSGHPKAKVIAKNVVWGYADEDWPMDFISTLNDILGRESLKEGKGKDLHPNQIHPQELRMGIRVEMEHTDDPKKAEKIALDHLAENPFYYTALKLSGIESPSAPKVKAVKEKKTKKRKESIQLVDLVNGMKKVKMPKAEEKKKLKEARFNISGEPNAAAEQAMKFVDGNATLKALSNDIEIQQSHNDAILRYDYWKPLPPEAVEKLKLQFDVELIEDFDEDTGNIIAYRLTPLRGKAEKYRAFQSKLEEIVKEVMAEYYFDGRDNLSDEIAAQQK